MLGGAPSLVILRTCLDTVLGDLFLLSLLEQGGLGDPKSSLSASAVHWFRLGSLEP